MPYIIHDFFDDLLTQEIEYCEKSELSEEQMTEIYATLKKIKPYEIVRVCYYDKEAYVLVEGTVGSLSMTYEYICVNGQKINFTDIKSIKRPDA